MAAKASETVRIDYPKHWFLLGTLALSAVIVFGAYQMYIAIEDFTLYFWLIADAAVAIIMSVLFVSPLLTHHLMGRKGLRIRMGLLIDETVPYSWIADVKETSIKRGGMTVGVGVRYSGIMNAVFVTSSFEDLVTIVFDSNHTMGRVLKKDVEQVVLSVVGRGRFASALKERAGLEEE